MNKRSHIHKKADSSASNPVQNQLQLRPFIAQAQSQSQKPISQTETETQEFQQHNSEATKLKLQAKYGTITPEGQERLSVLQAKMSSSLQRRLEHASSNGSNFANIPISRADAPSQLAVQTKLTIGEPGDKYEQEADRVASQVVNQINAPASQQASQNLQREEVLEEEKDLQMKPMLQLRSAKVGMTATADLETAINQARSGGLPLADNVRQPMERAFGADFSRVNVHTDTQADQLNKSIQAQAFTTGRDVFFRQGEYNPGSRGGQELIAHELTHVLQQNGGAVKRSRYLQGYELIQEQPEFSNTPTQAKTRTKKNIVQRYTDYTVLQRYTTILPTNATNYPTKKKENVSGLSILGNKDLQNDELFFVRQEESNLGEWTNSEGKPNLIYNGRVPLKISQNSELAIEDTPEAKIFFATTEKVKQANSSLEGRVKLLQSPKYLAVTTNNQTKKLYKVKPIVESQKQKGLEVRTPQACDQMAQFVSGNKSVTGSSGITAANKTVIALLDKVTPQDPTYSAQYENVFKNASSATRSSQDIKAYEDFLDMIAEHLEQLGQNQANNQTMLAAMEELNINQFMNPTIGKAIATVSLATKQQLTNAREQGRDLFEYHWGTVVAKDGEDYITMENYVRRNGNTTLSSGDPLFYFRMYGTTQDTQKWYRVQTATQSFLNPVVSIEIR